MFGSVAGGGRYDDLVARFTGQQVPATGISIGVSRLIAALASRGLAAMERMAHLEELYGMRSAWNLALEQYPISWRQIDGLRGRGFGCRQSVEEPLERCAARADLRGEEWYRLPTRTPRRHERVRQSAPHDAAR